MYSRRLVDHKISPWVWYDLFNKEQCEQIKNYCYTHLSLERGTIRKENDNQIVYEKTRISDVTFLPNNEETDWIFTECVNVVNQANDEWFRWNLSHIESLQFGEYKNGGFYDFHLDSNWTEYEQLPRKLSFSILLTDPSEYEGGELEFRYGKDPESIKPELGQIIFFRSDTLHRVSPVKSGVRNSLVGWVRGEPFK